MSRVVSMMCLVTLCGSAGSCALPDGMPWQSAAVPGNPLIIRAQNPELVWERTVDVLHAYHFEIQRENKLSGEIETFYRTGSGVLEPWHADSVGFDNRLESTLQSIRRKVIVRIGPSPEGYVVAVEALKEIEYVAPDSTVLMVAPPPEGAAAWGWMPRGRDLELEQALICSLQEAFAG